MNYALLVSLAATALATPPACLLACVAEVSKNSDSCSNSLENIACIFSSLGDDLNKCLDSKCPNNNADAAKSAFSAAASQQGATKASSASSSAPATSSAASSEASSTQPASSAASSEASSTQAASSAAESSAATSEASKTEAATSKASKTEAATSEAATSKAAESNSAPTEKTSAIQTSVDPVNGAVMVGSSVGLMGAFVAAVLL